MSEVIKAVMDCQASMKTFILEEADPTDTANI